MKASFFDLLERAAWTFVQAFAAVFAVTPLDNGKTALAAAVAAGLSAAKTLVKSTL